MIAASNNTIQQLKHFFEETNEKKKNENEKINFVENSKKNEILNEDSLIDNDLRSLTLSLQKKNQNCSSENSISSFESPFSVLLTGSTGKKKYNQKKEL